MAKYYRISQALILASSFIFMTMAAAESVDGAANPTKSEYFVTTGGGFLYQMSNGSERERLYTYLLSLEIIKQFDEQVFAQFEFQNPAGSKAAPLRAERLIQPSDKKLSVESAPVKGVKISQIYTVALRVYSNSQKTRLVTEHIQKIQAPAQFQIQWVVALRKGYTQRKCDELHATILGPAAWHFKQAAGDDISACFLTKEDIDGPEGRYLTGVTIQRFSNLRSEDGKDLPRRDIAVIGLKALTEKHKVIRLLARGEEPYPGYEIEYVARNTTPPTHILQIWRAGAQPASAILMMAEAPAARWRTEWEALEPIIRTIQFEPQR